MQLCILGLKGSHTADDTLSEILELDGEKNRWLLEVATIARPLVGRVRVGVTFPDGESKTFHEGDLSKAAGELGGWTGYYVSALAGPFGSIFATSEGQEEGSALGSEAEQSLFHLDDVKKVLPRDSSAMVLIAQDDLCGALIKMAEDYSPKVVRLEVEDDLRERLEALELRVQLAAQAGAGEPARY